MSNKQQKLEGGNNPDDKKPEVKPDEKKQEEMPDISQFQIEPNLLLDDEDSSPPADKKEPDPKPKDEKPADDEKPKVEKSDDDDIFDLGDDPDKPDKPDADDGDEIPDDKPDDSVEEKKERNDALRTQLKKANSAAAEAKEVADKLVKENEDLKKKIEEESTKASELQKKMSLKDPKSHPEVQSIYNEFNKSLGEEIEALNFSSSEKIGNKLNSSIGSLVAMYSNLGDPKSEGHEDRVDELQSTLRDEFPGEEKRVFQLIRKGSRTLQEANAKIADIEANASQYEYSEAKRQHDEVVNRYKELTKTSFNPSRELMEAQPYNPEVYFRNVLDAEAKDGSSATAETLRKVERWAEFALTVPAPLSDDDLAKIPEGQRDAAISERQARWEKATADLTSRAAVNEMCRQKFPEILKALAESERELLKYREAKPRLGDGEGDDGVPDEKEQKYADIKDFVPSNPLLDDA